MKKTENYEDQQTLGESDVNEALELLRSYRDAKRRTDERIWDEMQWWQNRHDIKHASSVSGVRPVSAWLFNSVCNKHADMCDNVPTAKVLPREMGDERAAEMLSKILPVICDRCGFEKTYSDNAWYKLRHGMSAWGVFWNSRLENGLGDIDICRMDIMDIFWDVNAADIQDSDSVFIVGKDTLEAVRSAYPHFKGTYGGETREDGERVEVIDWYYKRRGDNGRMLLHYAKLCEGELLYASENDPVLEGKGWYEHGQYPIVLDILFPDVNTSTGYGYLAVGRNPQGYIDELDGHILEYANTASRVRYWAKRSLGINEKDFLNPDKRIIEVEGDIDEEKLRQITLSPMDGMLGDVRKMKIDELKETTGNRDVSQGSTSGGVTAAQAIEALQEAGNKGSRDMIAGSYRAYTEIMRQVIELLRQFYDGVRCFRITGKDGGRRYVRYSNTGLQDKTSGVGGDGTALYRHPAFDVEVRAEREHPLDRAERNQLLLELYRAGMFDPANRGAALGALSGMDFEGVEALRALLKQADGQIPSADRAGEALA